MAFKDTTFLSQSFSALVFFSAFSFVGRIAYTSECAIAYTSGCAIAYTSGCAIAYTSGCVIAYTLGCVMRTPRGVLFRDAVCRNEFAFHGFAGCLSWQCCCSSVHQHQIQNASKLDLFFDPMYLPYLRYWLARIIFLTLAALPFQRTSLSFDGCTALTRCPTVRCCFQKWV